MTIALLPARGSEAEGRPADWLFHSSDLHGQLVDLSMNGIAVALEQPLQVGEQIMVRITNQVTGRTRDCTARVVRVHSCDDGRWKVMGQFATKLTLEQIYDFALNLPGSRYI